MHGWHAVPEHSWALQHCPQSPEQCSFRPSIQRQYRLIASYSCLTLSSRQAAADLQGLPEQSPAQIPLRGLSPGWRSCHPPCLRGVTSPQPKAKVPPFRHCWSLQFLYRLAEPVYFMNYPAQQSGSRSSAKCSKLIVIYYFCQKDAGNYLTWRRPVLFMSSRQSLPSSFSSLSQGRGTQE